MAGDAQASSQPMQQAQSQAAVPHAAHAASDAPRLSVRTSKVIGVLLDAALLAVLAVITFVGAYLICGLDKLDFSSLNLMGSIFSDLVGEVVRKDLVGKTGWYWFNPFISAPDGSYEYNFAANLLNNVENVIGLIIYQFNHDAITTFVVQYLLIFPMCACSSYAVMRSLGVNRAVAFGGSWAFGWAPYIFARVGHFSLATCYFIPLSVLLCIWAFTDESLFKPGKGFFTNKRHWLALLFALLIANNGIGYYAFFTCMFFVVTGLCGLITTRKLSSLRAPIVLICLVGFFFVLALMPALLNGTNGSQVRTYMDGEIYGLKLVQMFIPIDGDDISFLGAFIDHYTKDMPNVNENRSAYLGVAGCIGFVLSMLYLFRRNADNDNPVLFLTSRLNIVAVLVGTMGGVGTLLFITVLRSIRAYNRISIFIAFMSLLFLCVLLSDFLKRRREASKGTGGRILLAVFSVVIVCLFGWSAVEQMADPGVFSEEAQTENAVSKQFFAEVESEAPTGSSIYALPYVQYPESMPVGEVGSHSLAISEIFTSNLKWSYGAEAGTKNDDFAKAVGSCPSDESIQAIKEKGFAGIFLDADGYTNDPEGLRVTLERLTEDVDSSPLVSENGRLYYFQFS